MNDKDFYNSLGKILNDPPEFAFEENAWAELDKRMAVKPEAAPSRRRWWMIAALWFLPFLLLGSLFYSQLWEANKKITDLQNEIRSIITDTTVNRQVTHQYDTVYHIVKVPVEQKVYHQHFYNGAERAGLAAGRLPATRQAILDDYPQLGATFYASETMLNSAESGPLTIARLQAMIPVDEAGDLNEDPSLNSVFLKEPMMQISSLYPEEIPSSAWYPLPPERIYMPRIDAEKKQPRSMLAFLKPTGFRAGGVLGSGLYYVFQGSEKFGFTYGFTAEVEFGSLFNLGLGVELFNLEYQLDGNSNLESYPTVDPENPLDELKELKVKARYVEIPVSLKFFLVKDKKFRPYLGGGIISRRAISQDLKYEFEGISDEYDRFVNLGSGDFKVNTIKGFLGGEYAVLDRLFLQLELAYQHDLERIELERFDYLGIKTGLLYKF